MTTPASNPTLASQIFSRNMLICVFTGFSSGLPLFVLLQMLPVWLTDKGLSVELIGVVTGVTLPYGLKFLWAPLLDRYFPNFLGRRRSWLLISQIILLILLYAISQFDPSSQLTIVANIAFLIAFFSATQDIVLDAYRREILTDKELGLGNTIHINAYRVAGLIPGGLSLYRKLLFKIATNHSILPFGSRFRSSFSVKVWHKPWAFCFSYFYINSVIPSPPRYKPNLSMIWALAKMTSPS